MYTVEISDGTRSTYRQRHRLRDMGFSYDSSTGRWRTHEESRKRIAAYERFARRKKLRIRAYDQGYERSADYRKAFFAAYKPAVKGRYLCAYCGRPLKREQVTVDHIISVDRAQRSGAAQRALARRGISDVNDPRNLCAACRSCNSSKSNKGGLWEVRGRIGRHPAFWIIAYALLAAVLAGAAACIVMSGLIPL